MIETVFNTVLRTVAIPIVAIAILQTSFLGEKGGFLAVVITLTIVNILSILWQAIKALPNLVLLKTQAVLRLALRIFIELFSVIGFWIFYFSHYAQ